LYCNGYIFRYSATYGNPYLRSLANGGGGGSSTTFAALTANHPRPYATLNTRGGQSPGAVRAAKNYTGTMIGNGSLGRRAEAAAAARNGNGVNNGKPNRYIMSNENEEAKNNAALATHV
jgi:hypothetical protein